MRDRSFDKRVNFYYNNLVFHCDVGNATLNATMASLLIKFYGTAFAGYNDIILLTTSPK